jgi:heterodisulfide reductase subunit B
MRNLAEVEKDGFDKLLIPCTACYARFKIAQYELEHSPELKEEVEDIIEYKFKGNVEVVHPLEALSKQDVLNKIKEMVVKDLSKLKVVSYYGCLLLRPPKMVGFKDNFENPQTMDRVLMAADIKTLDWSFKTECCGGSLSITKPDIVCELSQRIFDNAKAVGAEVISVPCTFCHLNLDTRQGEIEKRYGESYQLPILYFTQLLALALGVPGSELLLNKHFVDTRNVLEKVA